MKNEKHDPQTKTLLPQGEERYRALIALAADGILLGSSDGFVLEANDQMCAITGMPREELVGKHVSEMLFTPESLRKTPFRFDLLRKGEAVLSERTLRRPDGTEVIVEMRTKKMPDGTYQSIYRDITERKKLMEHALQAQKLESLGVLAGGIAHDFNNLLAGLFGYIDLARIAQTTEETSRYLSKAMDSIDRARGLTRQLLTFSKGGTPVKRVGPLSPFIEETTRFALSGSTVSCRFDIPRDLPPCDYDPGQMAQVLDNLVRNAQQAMPMGGVITVAARLVHSGRDEHSALSEGPYISVSVIDTGIGIPQELLTRIFDPFFTTKEQGHGLGLATCYSIVKQHGGAFAVASDPGKGSTFTVYLPAVDD